MTNKEITLSFLKMAGSGEVRSAYDKFIAVNFIHHNQYFKGDRGTLLKGMEEAHLKSPNKSIDIKKIYEDGNTVITHSLVQKENMSIAVVHIVRIEKGKIVELWDLGQAIDTNSPNENGMF